MNQKENILESWIMVEHLSEGNINLKDKTVLTLSGLQKDNYFDLFFNEIQKKKMKSYQKGGIVLYFDVFPFSEIVDFLRKEYHLSATEQEVTYGDKFSFALYFDKGLKQNCKMTFLTESYYIRKFRKIPKESEFLSFEEQNKKSFEEIFECPEDVDYKTHFNEAIKSILQDNNVDIKNCRMKVLLNLETDATNLHSFFVGDLQRAKTISADILDSYILGNSKSRIDLDSRVRSGKFNEEMFYNILQPNNYPVARFPSNPKFALSFMQQVAVNLTIGFDNEQVRSVNGPPGTGKTTLLKDIFAELVVEQACEMVALSERHIKGTEATKYWHNASIGIVPEKIADKGIVVASSNNGAVQNIVNELPLVSGIDKEFIEILIDADYFRIIANSNVGTEWVEDENGKREQLVSKENGERDKFWGLFSLEGGRKENMEHIVTVLKHVAHYLESEYEPNEIVYQNFRKQYDKVNAYRMEMQASAEKIKELHLLLEKIAEKSRLYEKNKFDRQNDLSKSISEIAGCMKRDQSKMEVLGVKVWDFKRQLLNLEGEKNSINQCIEALKLQKPGFFSPKKMKVEFKEKSKIYSEQLQKVISDERIIKSQIYEAEGQEKKLQDKITQNETKLMCVQDAFDKWAQEAKSELLQMQNEAEVLKRSIDFFNINELDFNVDYETLQLSNPWFDIEYRRMQSLLFVLGLQVRKQFLYENVKNIKAAYIIWNKQKDYLEHKQVIYEAWNWINMVIPVISSTFASFSRMCANMGKETIGHLFVDEAGQALPQTSVGAIFRSRHVMVVGDPSQIKPVMTLDPSILNMLGEYYGVSQKYLSENASTQTLVDEISQYGFYKDNNREEWIGIPLWVHRRCKYPMFEIANKISYGGNMVQGVKGNGRSEWFDINGTAMDKYVAEQGIFLREKIREMIALNPDIVNKESKDIIYVISPFKNVAFQLSQELKKIGFTRYDENGKPTNVGTVHTFQGKAASIVFLVLGADKKSKGAANWAMGTKNPNIMNVAATRAKNEFYIIGSKKLYMNLKSDVIKDTYEIIKKFNSMAEGVN